MTLIQRFTRDAASKYIWAGLTLVSIVALAWTVTSGSRALEDEREAAQARAVGYVTDVLQPRLDATDLSAPIVGPGARPLNGAVNRAILSADERVDRVRIWSVDGHLLFSTDRGDDPGSDEALNDDVLHATTRDGVLTQTGISDTGGADDPERTLLRTYVPLGTAAVAEIDQTGAATLDPVRSEWRWYQVIAGIAVALFLGLTILSLRDPIDPINTGVPFGRSSIPAGYSLIDDARLHAVEDVYRLAQERVARLEERLAESEEVRRRLEGLVQRSLSKAGPGSPPPPAAAPTPSPAEAPPVIRVPESELVATLRESWAAPAAGSLARATRDETEPPAVGGRPTPAAAKPWTPAKPAKRAKRAKQTRRQKAAQAREQRQDERTRARAQERFVPGAIEEPPEPKRWGRRRTIQKPAPTKATLPPPTAAPVPAPAAPRRPAPQPAPAPAEPPARQPAAVSASRAARRSVEAAGDDAAAHEAALETFIRLTESDRQPHDTSDVDQGAVRAALARTAARKKPGGDKLQPHERPPDGSPGS
jgi:hypothetical protein